MSELPLHLYERKAGQKLFVPSTGYKGLSRPPKPIGPKPVEDEELKREKFAKDQEFFDEETGEPLQLTKAKWTPKEGRLSLNAKTILSMGTGLLDLKYSSHGERSSTYNPNLLRTPPQNYHPLVSQFMADGPLTPMMHQNWNPRTDKVDLAGDTASQSSLPSLKSDSQSESSSTISSKARKFQLETANVAKLVDSKTRELVAKYNEETKNIVPDRLAVNRASNWKRIYESTFNELFGIAEQLERNKSLTLEERNRGGIAKIRKTCQQLAKFRVKYMQEVVQAVDDEDQKDRKREIHEIENYEKPELLKEIQKTNREERRKGRLYIEALQRDQEIVFMAKLRDAGLLW